MSLAAPRVVLPVCGHGHHLCLVGAVHEPCPLGEADNFTQFYFPEPGQLKVFLKGGSSLVVNTGTGEAVYESVKPRPLIAPMVKLHFNPGSWWTWFADIFAVCLILITLTGIWMVKGPKGLWGRGGVELIIGILIPILFLLI